MLSCSWIYEYTIMRDEQAVPLPARFSMLVTTSPISVACSAEAVNREHTARQV
jgi:hypothetical protein